MAFSPREVKVELEELGADLREALSSGDKCIAFFVYHGEASWLIDWKDYFTLDHQKDIDALCNEERYRGFLPANLTVQQWNEKLQREFRNGIPRLTPDKFIQYRNGETAKVVTREMLHQEFFSEDKGDYAELAKAIEAEISFNYPMREHLVRLRIRLSSKLPKFYINYDRNIFMHMVTGRFYEQLILDDWLGAEGDFEHLIPTSHRYWVRSTKEDFWAVTKFSNG